MAKGKQPSSPACLLLFLASSLENLERGRSRVDKPMLGLCVGRQWEPGESAGRVHREAWKRGSGHPSQLVPVASSWYVLAEHGMFGRKWVGTAEGNSSPGQSTEFLQEKEASIFLASSLAQAAWPIALGKGFVQPAVIWASCLI